MLEKHRNLPTPTKKKTFPTKKKKEFLSKKEKI